MMGMPKTSLLYSLCTALLLMASARAERVSKGLLTLYDFSNSSGDLVEDRSGKAPLLHLRIANSQNIRRSAGSLEVHSPTIICSDRAATKINGAIKRSGEITVEAWIHPANTQQAGPARLVTVSSDSSNRNFTIGQESHKYDSRFRTNKSGNNGLPSIPSASRSVKMQPSHVVYTRETGGRAIFYIDGKKVTEKNIAGTPNNWDSSMKLALANELSNDRPWLGTFYLVAIYDRALSQSEVSQNLKEGHGAGAPVVEKKDVSAELFETKVAAIFANHCLECHDSAARKGKLDLSHQITAFAGGKEGTPIIPGKSADSLLWQTVASDEMPEDRPPLSKQEKQALRQWIDSGAAWPGDFIDPADYVHKTQTAQNFIRRLTLPEYIATVLSATGVDISVEARDLLPPDMRADGFSNTAYNLNIDLKHIDAYARLASIIVDRIDVAKFAKRFSANRSLTDKPMRAHINSMGKWMLRAPLEGHELDAFRGISTTVAGAGGGFDEAVSYIVEAMLQSPRFIYHMEDQNGSLSQYEIAARISYITWGAPPDEALNRAAEKGQIGKEVDRMLADPRAIDRSLQFASDWLFLDRLKHLNPSAERFPNWDPRLAIDMRNETLAYFREIVWKQQRPLTDLFNAQLTFATPVLAEHYGLSPVSTHDSFARYDLSKAPSRGGLLTQGSILTVGGDDASMVTRGLFVLHDVLRGTVKDPPPGTDTTPVPSKPGVTHRSVALDRIKSKSCGGCHKKFEPLAFGLEKYNGIGAFSERDEHGNALREDGEILFPGEPEPTSYKDAAELMDLLAKSDRVAQTITRKVTQFALGRPLTPADRSTVEKIHQQSQKDGGTYQSLIRAIITSKFVQP
ncbi:MAG: hypothetical protein ACI8XO_003625 [Verrucomicrobiales bacterium]|jgi:hypothetical protein